MTRRILASRPTLLIIDGHLTLHGPIFVKEVGILDVMMNGDNGGQDELEVDGKIISCLMLDHPGAAPIKRSHLRIIERRIAEYKAKHPDHRAEYPPPKPGAKPILGDDTYREEDYSDDPRFDGNLCSAEWLIFWMKWALENCSKPTFINS